MRPALRRQRRTKRNVYEALAKAAAAGDAAAVELLLAVGAGNGASLCTGSAALACAAASGDANAVSALLTAGVSVTAPNGCGAIALTVAALKGHTAVVEALLAAGACKGATGGKVFTEPVKVAFHGDAAALLALPAESAGPIAASSQAGTGAGVTTAGAFASFKACCLPAAASARPFVFRAMPAAATAGHSRLSRPRVALPSRRSPAAQRLLPPAALRRLPRRQRLQQLPQPQLHFAPLTAPITFGTPAVLPNPLPPREGDSEIEYLARILNAPPAGRAPASGSSVHESSSSEGSAAQEGQSTKRSKMVQRPG